MPNFEKLYFTLFAAVADAVEYLEQGRMELAQERLIAAMQDSEERYVESGE